MTCPVLRKEPTFGYKTGDRSQWNDPRKRMVTSIARSQKRRYSTVSNDTRKSKYLSSTFHSIKQHEQHENAEPWGSLHNNVRMPDVSPHKSKSCIGFSSRDYIYIYMIEKCMEYMNST